MTRYQALRGVGCDPVTAVTIAALNRLWGVPKGTIVFMHIEIEYTQ